MNSDSEHSRAGASEQGPRELGWGVPVWPPLPRPALLVSPGLCCAVLTRMCKDPLPVG